MFGIRCISLCLALVMASASGVRAERPVTIFAAASLKTVLDTIQPDLPHETVISYGGSAAMARQVAQGARADLVILAHPDWMAWLAGQGALAHETRCTVIANRLVLAAPVSAQTDLSAESSSDDVVRALNGGRLGVGNLRAVPAGQYAARFMEGAGWLADLRGHLAQLQTVRQVLALLARGEVPLGFVYASDVAAEPAVRTVFEIVRARTGDILYPMAQTTKARAGTAEVAKALARSGSAFEAAGFAAVPDSVSDACR